MISDLMSEFANSSAQTMRQVLEPTAPGYPPALVVKVLLHELRLVLNFISGYRDYLSGRLADIGIEGTSFRRACETMANALDDFLKHADGLRAVVEQHALHSENTAQLEELERFKAQATNTRRSFTEWLEVLNRPLSADFWEKALAAAAEGGPYIRVDKYEDLFGDAEGCNSPLFCEQPGGADL
jgi:hypothetical protein